MLVHEAIDQVGVVHTEGLTLTTSCRMYNSFEEALTGEALKVLRRKAVGKLVSIESRKG